MFNQIKSPVGEVVSDADIVKGIVYMHDDVARLKYKQYFHTVCMYNEQCRKFEGHDAVKPDSFADWLEAQGVRLL